MKQMLNFYVQLKQLSIKIHKKHPPLFIQIRQFWSIWGKRNSNLTFLVLGFFFLFFKAISAGMRVRTTENKNLFFFLFPFPEHRASGNNLYKVSARLTSKPVLISILGNVLMISIPVRSFLLFLHNSVGLRWRWFCCCMVTDKFPSCHTEIGQWLRCHHGRGWSECLWQINICLESKNQVPWYCLKIDPSLIFKVVVSSGEDVSV